MICLVCCYYYQKAAYEMRISNWSSDVSSSDHPGAASAMAAALTADNRMALEGRFGRPMEPVDLYLAHFLGSGGAMRFLAGLEADPDQPGATMLPQAAAANRPIFYAGDGRMRSLGEIRDLFAAKLAADGSPPALSAPSDRKSTRLNSSH